MITQCEFVGSVIFCFVIGLCIGYSDGKSKGWSDCSLFYRGQVLPAYLREIKFLRRRKK